MTERWITFLDRYASQPWTACDCPVRPPFETIVPCRRPAFPLRRLDAPSPAPTLPPIRFRGTPHRQADTAGADQRISPNCLRTSDTLQQREGAWDSGPPMIRVPRGHELG